MMMAARQLLLDDGAEDPFLSGFPIVRLSRAPRVGDKLREIVEWTGLYRQDCANGTAYDIRFDDQRKPEVVTVLRDRSHALIRNAWDKLNDQRGIFANFTRVAVLTLPVLDTDFVWMLADHELWADGPSAEFSGAYVTGEALIDLLVPCLYAAGGRSNQT